jgi:Asp-tRNA(Asn)/Glu-tRNA(Gln) amidotransferase A subunit family amidase
VFALKPSFGRVPIYPPYFGRVVGPMTRSVEDAALLMATLNKPDARDFMALPYQAIDWSSVLVGDVQRDLKDRKIGLLLDVGAGLKPQPDACGV